MKKLTALVLALVMCFGLVACGSTPAPSSTPASESTSQAETTNENFVDPVNGWDVYDELIDQIRTETDLEKRAEMMHQAEDILMEDAAEALEGLQDFETWSGALREMLEKVQANRVLVLNVYRSVSREQVEQYLYKMLDPLLRIFVERLNIPVKEEDKQFIIDFYKYGFVGLALEWIRRDMKADPAIMAERLNTIMQGDLKRALQRFRTDGKASIETD